MNVRLTVLLVVLAVMVGGAWAVIEFGGVVSRGDAPAEEPWLFHIDEGDITYISVAHGGAAVEYRRDAGGHQWMILGEPDYPVFQQRWGGTPLLLSGPRVNRGLGATIRDPAQYGLEPPESVVRVGDWAGNSFEFHMGSPTPDGANQYARLVGDDALYTVPAVWADVVNRLADDPPYGRLFDLDVGIITAVQVSAGGATAVYYFDGGEWLVYPQAPPVEAEGSLRVSGEWAGWLVRLAGPRVDAVVEQRVTERDAEKLAVYGMDDPAARVVIARRGMATVEFVLGGDTADGGAYYARIVNGTDEALYAIKKSRLEGILGLARNPLAEVGGEGSAGADGSGGADGAGADN